MKADLSRATFDKARRYRSVRMQQGRVQLDADFNEQQDILNHRMEIETRDSLGPVAVPIDNPGFGLTPSGTDLTISAGRLYVDGLLCENPSTTTVANQPDLPDTASPVLPASATTLPLPPVGVTAASINGVVVFNASNAVAPAEGTYLAYLEAWQRHLSPLDLPVDDTSMREVALGGPDTCTREKTVWQVKLLRAGELNAALTCLSNMAAWNTLTAAPDGRLAARAEASIPPKTPCQLPPEAGYRLLENHLYRVEIHDDASITGKARYKWSRDNGSLASRVVRWLGDPIADEFEVASIGRDDVLAITAGCWVEFYDDTHELLGQPGPLVPVIRTEGNVVTVDLSKLIGHALDKAMFPRNPRVRRWDGVAEIRPAAIASLNTGWEELAQDGIELKFAPGSYRIGDYWLIPARTATAAIEWPQESNKPAFLAPAGVLRAFAKLALLEFKAGTWVPISDCRPLFPSLTQLTQMHYVGGDGQSIKTNPPPNKPAFVTLPSPLQVGVANGQFPVARARILFTALNGRLANGTAAQIVETGLDGIASIVWSVASDPSQSVQHAKAELLIPGQDTPVTGRYLPVHFTAQLALASDVAYDPSNCTDLLNANAFTVQQAIDELCKRPQSGGCCTTVGLAGEYETLDLAIGTLLKDGFQDICICLLPGQHTLKDNLIFSGKKSTKIHIHGAGNASRLMLGKSDIRFQTFASLVFEDFVIVKGDTEPGFQFADSHEVRFSRVLMAGSSSVGNSLLRITDTSRLVMENCNLLAFVRDSMEKLEKLSQTFPGLKAHGDLFSYLMGGNQDELNSTVDSLIALKPEERKKLAQEIESVLKGNGAAEFSPAEQRSLATLARVMVGNTKDGRAVRNTLLALDSAIRTTQPSFALALDGVREAMLIDNRLRGRISIFGEASIFPDLDENQRKRLGGAIAQGEVSFDPFGSLILERNVFQGMRFSDSALKDAVGAFKGKLPVWDYLQVSNNRIESDQDHYPGSNCAFTGNRLNQDDHAGIVFSNQAKIIGNFSSAEFSLFVSGTDPEVFGNGNLRVRPL